MFIEEIKWLLYKSKDRDCIQGVAKINNENWSFPEYLDDHDDCIKKAQIKIIKDILKMMNR
jgi:hypothetical protein